MGDESIFRDVNPANVAKSLLEGNRDHLLTQTRSELMKQEQKMESLNNCICELQQQALCSTTGFGEGSSRIC